jgi:hypothetical protein
MALVAILCLVPVVAVAAGYLVPGVSVTVWLVVGGLIVRTGVAVAQTASATRPFRRTCPALTSQERDLFRHVVVMSQRVALLPKYKNTQKSRYNSSDPQRGVTR